MKLYILNEHDPHKNLAVEEYLFETSSEDVIILWQNAPTVVIGKNQNAYAEINTDYTEKNGILIARRISGGGAVYHDLGNVNYTFISNQNNSGIDFKTFTLPIIEALSSLGINAELTGRNDIEVNGKKISGNAQHVKGNRVLHHGTLLFNSDLTVLSNALNVDEEKIKAKAIKSTRSRVANILELLDHKINVRDFIKTITDYVISKYRATLVETPHSKRIDELTARNKSREWLFPEKDYVSRYTVRKKRKFDFGIVEILLEMKNDTLISARIIGDFFGTKDINNLEAALIGSKISEIEKKEIIGQISDYIHGMTSEQFLSLIK